MPKYKKEINRLVELDEVKQMMNNSRTRTHQVVIAILYLTGARPIEIIDLERKDFLFHEDFPVIADKLIDNPFTIDENDMLIDIRTAKKGLPRILPFDQRTTPFIKEIIIPCLDEIKNTDDRLFRFRTETRIKQIVYDASNNQLCPYNFRHNRLSRLGMLGASLQELMYWKGAKDPKSVMPYLYRNPSVLNRFKDKIR